MKRKLLLALLALLAISIMGLAALVWSGLNGSYGEMPAQPSCSAIP